MNYCTESVLLAIANIDYLYLFFYPPASCTKSLNLLPLSSLHNPLIIAFALVHSLIELGHQHNPFLNASHTTEELFVKPPSKWPLLRVDGNCDLLHFAPKTVSPNHRHWRTKPFLNLARYNPF